MLPYKKHGTKKRSKNNKGKQKESNRLKNVTDDEHIHVQVEWVNPPETGSVSKRSIKTRIRELMAKDDNSKRRVSYLPEQSDHGDKADSSSKDNKSVEVLGDVDILELFNVNKQIFLKMLSDHDLHNKGRLTKSGSFPSVNSTNMKEWGPRKLEDKQREIWPLTTKSDGIQLTTTSKGKLRSMRRATSLTDSVDRYSQLFGSTSSFNKDIKRNLSSRSLKLMINENDEPTPKFRRRLSLPECDYESLLPNLETSREAGNKDSAEPCEDVMNKEMNEEISHIIDEKDDVEVAIDCDAQESLGSVPISEEIPETHKTDQILSTEELEDEEINPEFHYVKLVLELSGFTAKEQTWDWYTIEQPLNPSIFEEIEKQYFPFEQLKCSIKMEENKWGRRLIFDLINEALVEIDEKSCLYYPRALSFSCRVHSIPRGERLLEEVWVFVGRCLSWRPELDPTLDFAVAQDLNGRNGWMNLQIESECVALELEDMIIDELLLEEVLLSCP